MPVRQKVALLEVETPASSDADGNVCDATEPDALGREKRVGKKPPDTTMPKPAISATAVSKRGKVPVASRQAKTSKAKVAMPAEPSSPDSFNDVAAPPVTEPSPRRRREKQTPVSLTHSPAHSLAPSEKVNARAKRIRLLPKAAPPRQLSFEYKSPLPKLAVCEPTPAQPSKEDPSQETIEKVESAVKGLNKLESEIMSALFPTDGTLPQSYDVIAARFGMTVEEVKGVADNALRGLRGIRSPSGRVSTVWN